MKTVSRHILWPVMLIVLSSVPAQAVNGFYYPTPSWDQKLPGVCTVRRSLGLEQRGGFGSGDGPRLAKGAGCLQDELDAQRSILQHQQSEPGESFWLAASHLVGIDKSH